MDVEKRGTLDQLAIACAGQLFAHYGLDLAASRARVDDPSQYAGVISLVGDALVATVAVAVPRSVIVATAGESLTTELDWAGELANQLAGRLKNELLRWGVEVQLGPPLAMGGGPELSAHDDEATHDLSLQTSAGPVRIWLKAAEVGAFEFTQRSSQSAVDEGELLLFF